MSHHAGPSYKLLKDKFYSVRIMSKNTFILQWPCVILCCGLELFTGHDGACVKDLRSELQVRTSISGRRESLRLEQANCPVPCNPSEKVERGDVGHQIKMH